MIGAIGSEGYDDLCGRVIEVVEETTPAGAAVAVINKGDARLLELGDRRGLHFPADEDGRYAGYYPRTGEEAVAQVESARRAGAEYLCIPATSLWWLDHYAALGSWLGLHCEVTARRADTCVIYDLVRPPATAAAERQADSTWQLAPLLDALLPADALLFVVGFDADGLAESERTVQALGPGDPTALRRRLEGRPDRPTFLLLPPEGTAPEIVAVVERATELVADRPGLCALHQVKGTGPRGRKSPANRVVITPKTTVAADDGPTDELTRRLERLGLAGQHGDRPRKNQV